MVQRTAKEILMNSYSMYLYPWDLREEGAGNVVSRLRDAGINGATVTASYHNGKFLRPHAPGGKVYFPEGGTVYFKPDQGRYGTLKPKQAEMAAGFDAFAEIHRQARDFTLTAWVVGLHNSRLGTLHPYAAAETAFGDKLINSLCPAQPDARAYLRALCVDVAARPGVGEIAIETPGWQAFRHGHHHEFELVDLPAEVQIALGTCFCPECMGQAQAAGVDMPGLRASTRKALDGFFATGEPEGLDPVGDPDWQALHRWRAETVAGLVAEVRRELPRQTRLAVIPTTQSPNSLCFVEGSDLKLLAAAADRLEVPVYQSGPAAIGDDAAEVRQAAGAGAEIGFILRPSFPNLTTQDDVCDAVARLRALDPSSISFYNYGHFPLRSLDWVRAALAS